MQCELVKTELLADDYIFHIRRRDGSVVKLLVPREDSAAYYERMCMENGAVHGLNLVTEGHYT